MGEWVAKSAQKVAGLDRITDALQKRHFDAARVRALLYSLAKHPEVILGRRKSWLGES